MDNTFDPDAYLATKAPAQPSGFDPDAYIAAKANTPSGLPEPQDIDNPPAGAEVPAEQRLMNNIQTIGQGYSIGAGVQGLAGLAGGVLKAIPATENLVPAIGDAADNMLLKSMGTRAGQIKQMGGLEAARDAARVGREAGAGDIFSTERGRLANLKDFTTQEGQKIGALRQQAGTASPDILNQVENDLSAKYSPNNADVYSHEAPKVQEALNTVKNTAANVPGGVGPSQPLTNAGISKGITNLNNYAAGEKLRQPVNAMTDVANKLSAANNAEIAQSLGPDKAQEYLDALSKEHGAMHLQPVMQTGMAREAVSRGGGKGILQSMAQKAADAGGYRATAKGLDALKEALSAPVGPSRVNSLKSLTDYLANQQDEENQ